MRHIRRTVTLGIMAAVAGGAIVASAAPAQAWCTWSNTGVYSYYVCSGPECRVTVLGDDVVTCP